MSEPSEQAGVDLLKVQQAVNAAHENFLSAIEVQGAIKFNEVDLYLKRYLGEPVKRSKQTLSRVEKAVSDLRNFRTKFTNLIMEIGLTRMEMNSYVLYAGVTTIGTKMGEFPAMLDRINEKLQPMLGIPAKRAEQTAEVRRELPDLERLQVDVANLGYAVALLEQLSADLVHQRTQALTDFGNQYLSTRSTYQALKQFNREEIVDFLFEAIILTSDVLGVMSILKSAKDKVEKKRAPRANVQRGDTDIMFDLCDIIDLDEERFQSIAQASAEAKAYGEILKKRLEDANVKLGLRQG